MLIHTRKCHGLLTGAWVSITIHFWDKHPLSVLSAYYCRLQRLDISGFAHFTITECIHLKLIIKPDLWLPPVPGFCWLSRTLFYACFKWITFHFHANSYTQMPWITDCACIWVNIKFHLWKKLHFPAHSGYCYRQSFPSVGNVSGYIGLCEFYNNLKCIHWKLTRKQCPWPLTGTGNRRQGTERTSEGRF